MSAGSRSSVDESESHERSENAHAEQLEAASRALRNLLGVVIAVERRFTGESPLALLRQISAEPQWQWLRPLYQLIADIDHAVHEGDLPATEVAAIGAHALALLSGIGAPIEQLFLERYRALLQTDPEVAIAHSAALQALRKLPPEPDTEAERLRARHQWACAASIGAKARCPSETGPSYVTTTIAL